MVLKNMAEGKGPKRRKMSGHGRRPLNKGNHTAMSSQIQHVQTDPFFFLFFWLKVLTCCPVFVVCAALLRDLFSLS